MNSRASKDTEDDPVRFFAGMAYALPIAIAIWSLIIVFGFVVGWLIWSYL